MNRARIPAILMAGAAALGAAALLPQGTAERPSLALGWAAPHLSSTLRPAGGREPCPTAARDSVGVGEAEQLVGSEPFTVAVTCDMRYFSGPGVYSSTDYYRGACEAIAGLGETAFMVSPGDIDPLEDVRWTITETFGVSYTWHPVVGNHELPGQGTEVYTGANMDYLRGYDYGAVNPGPSGCPSTTFSFDYENVHFVILNEYCDVGGDTETDGDVPDHLYDWLAQDLAGATKEHVIVFGHEPGYPQPDADNGRLGHQNDSLNKYEDNRDRFWDLMRSQGVTAYVCGHTHNYSAVQMGGVWQLDAGHARGIGDTGARSTFVLIQVDGPIVTFEAYRDNYDGGPYVLADGGVLARTRIYFPLVVRGSLPE
jgi:hypothetical protein